MFTAIAHTLYLVAGFVIDCSVQVVKAAISSIAHHWHRAIPAHEPQTHQPPARAVDPADQTPSRWPTNGL